ncbi:MAG: CaiB/BaiF CoA transferase family protein [Hyphomonadaceae bacterium]
MGQAGPCAGYRVLDFSRFVAGPYCGQILADLGAEVIKVEEAAGEVMRHGQVVHNGMASSFEQYNRGKKSIVPDLKTERGRAAIRALAKTADVVMENFRPGVMEKMGLGYDDLREINPRLIYLKISGYGETGPYVDRPAFDQVIQGVIGFMPVQGAGGEPTPIYCSAGDKVTATWGANAVLGALLHRERTGEGQRISTSLLSAYSAFMLTEQMINHTFQDIGAQNIPYSTESFSPHRTKNGYVVGLILMPHQFDGFCAAIDRPDIHADPRFASPMLRVANARALIDAAADTMRTITSEDFVERAAKYDVPFAKVNNVEEFFEDPQVRASECVVDFKDEELGVVRHLNHPVTYEKSPADVRRRAPHLGEHNDEIAAELGVPLA